MKSRTNKATADKAAWGYVQGYAKGQAAERKRCIRAVEREPEWGGEVPFVPTLKLAKRNIIARIKQEAGKEER